MNVGPGYQFMKKVRGGVHWSMMESIGFNSFIDFRQKTKMVV